MQRNWMGRYGLPLIFTRPFAYFSTISLTILLVPGCGFADDVLQHPGAPWLDTAIAEKACPVTPINVPPELWGVGDALRARISISRGTLYVNGTDSPDHIVIGAGREPGFVHVKWNGKHLGRFGPISGIVLEGNGGDDVLIVKPSVHLPAVIDGGGGDDCLQGGSGGGQLLGGDGDDVLIAGTGRPALSGGSGNDRILVPQRMGTLRFAPGADSRVLRLLGDIYDLEPLREDCNKSRGTPSPVIVGRADLRDDQLLSLLHQARSGGQAVVITNATHADSEKLRLLLAHPNAASAPKGSKTGVGAGGPAPLVFFRAAPRPGTQAYDYRTGFFASLPNCLKDPMIASLSQVFSAAAIVPQTPGDGPSNDLLKLADSYTSTAMWPDGNGNSVQITNSAWGVRSFSKQADFYYFLQEVDYSSANSQNANDTAYSRFNLPYDPDKQDPIVIQTSPGSTQCSQSTTSSMAWSVGGNAGFNWTQGVNALLNGGVTVTDSKTISCPGTEINNYSDPADGSTYWSYSTQNAPAGLQTFYNQWIWEEQFSQYNDGQTQIQVVSAADGPTVAQLLSTIPLPFGDTFALQQPVVSSVSPACVDAGNTFTITGSGLYPSLITGVSINGTSVNSSQYSSVSDTELKVVAPSLSGYYLPVVVQTGEGLSNSNVTIEISVIHACQFQ